MVVGRILMKASVHQILVTAINRARQPVDHLRNVLAIQHEAERIFE
jgi:hypothetical protein